MTIMIQDLCLYRDAHSLPTADRMRVPRQLRERMVADTVHERYAMGGKTSSGGIGFTGWELNMSNINYFLLHARGGTSGAEW